MSFRFRRRIKLLPGVHLNISRSGISTSLGVRGASMTFGKRGTFVNAGIPGTGISYREKLQQPAAALEQPAPQVATQTEISHHHLHWWKIGLFLATMVLAGLTKNDRVIGIFWLGWIGYWLFLFVRLAIRNARKGAQYAKN